MRQQVLVSVLALATLVGACGGGKSDQVSLDSSVPEADSAPAVSPFVPVEIDTVIGLMIDAINEKNLAAADKPPVAVLLKDLTGFWSPISTGANRMIGTLVIAASVQAPRIEDQSIPEKDKGKLQNQYIQSYLDESIYQAMAVAPFSTSAESVQYINEFVSQRGPVVTIDSDSPASTRSYLIATSNYEAGVTAAKKLAEAMTVGDTVAVFGTTDPTWVSGFERANGAEKGAAMAGLRLAPRIPVVWKAETDKATIQAAISDTNWNIKGLLCMYSNSYLCADAVGAAEKKDLIKIFAFDMETETKAYFDQGYFVGVAVQRQFYMGELGVLVPYALVALGPVKTAQLLEPILVKGYLIDTGIDIITTANYGAYMEYLTLLGINS